MNQLISNILGKLYGDAEYVDERHRHRFEVHIYIKTITYLH